MSDSLFFHHAPTYLPLDELNAYYQHFASEYPQWCTLEEVGYTRQHQPIYLLSLTDHRSSLSLDSKPAFWIDAGTHAAEWAGISAALYGVSQSQAKLPVLNTICIYIQLSRLEERRSMLARWFAQQAGRFYYLPP